MPCASTTLTKPSSETWNLTHYRPAMPFGSRKNILEGRFSPVLVQFKEYHPSENLKFNYFGIF